MRRIAHSPAAIVDALLRNDSRVLLFGEPGVGKSRLAASLAQCLADAGRSCICLGADPGSPAFGAPGAVCLASWELGRWRLRDLEALCSLDAVRFRLPLVSAVRRLAARAPAATLLVDAPGAIRGVAAHELFGAALEAVAADAVILLTRGEPPPDLAPALTRCAARVVAVEAHPLAVRPNKARRQQSRTALWDAHLRAREPTTLRVDNLALDGAPPPLNLSDAWPGRQVALLDVEGKTLAFGEARGLEDGKLTVCLPPFSGEARILLARDARRGPQGELGTHRRAMTAKGEPEIPPDMVPPPGIGREPPLRIQARVGSATVTLVNGVFGDPLLHLRLRHQKRSLLFDLGDAGRLPARICHQITDVFISHAHFDHIGGFLWFLRSRLGHGDVCRLYGPAGLTGHIESMLGGIWWDRIGDAGPLFEVNELDGGKVRRWSLRAGGPGPEPLGVQDAKGGLLLEEPAFVVRAAELDHGGPVLAFAFEPSRQINIRKERLAERGLSPGPWLGKLKQHLFRNELDESVVLPAGGAAQVRQLAADLVLVTPPQRLVYATDLADNPLNREQLVALARGAHHLFCEAGFVQTDAAQARATQHLTARACGEIATAAGVTRLYPFHFSRRYESEPERVYREVAAAFAATVIPGTITL